MRFQCECGQWHRAEPDEAGRERRCGACKRIITAPAAEEFKADEEPTSEAVGKARGSKRLRLIIAALLVVVIVVVLAAVFGGPRKDERDPLERFLSDSAGDESTSAAETGTGAPNAAKTASPKTYKPRPKVKTVLRGNEGVTIRTPKAGGPPELTIDPFPEEGAPADKKDAKAPGTKTPPSAP